MDKLFIDTNVLLDYLAARAPFDQDAKSLIDLAETGRVEIVFSALSICNISYILKKIAPLLPIKQTLDTLVDAFDVTNIDAFVLNDALNSAFPDFEDAVQYFSAVRHGGVTHIVTRNISDFSGSALPVLSPSDYLAMLQP